MSLLPTGVVVAPGNNYFLANDTAIPGAQSGVSYGNTWSVEAGSVLGTIITVPGLVAGTAVQTSVQSRTTAAGSLVDCEQCWLITAGTLAPNKIYVYVKAGGTGTNGRPFYNADYGISWVVVGSSP
jgi:hypothetical protein